VLRRARHHRQRPVGTDAEQLVPADRVVVIVLVLEVVVVRAPGDLLDAPVAVVDALEDVALELSGLGVPQVERAVADVRRSGREPQAQLRLVIEPDALVGPAAVDRVRARRAERQLERRERLQVRQQRLRALRLARLGLELGAHPVLTAQVDLAGDDACGPASHRGPVGEQLDRLELVHALDRVAHPLLRRRRVVAGGIEQRELEVRACARRPVERDAQPPRLLGHVDRVGRARVGDRRAQRAVRHRRREVAVPERLVLERELDHTVTVGRGRARRRRHGWRDTEQQPQRRNTETHHLLA
jgi:hypothetical protein